MNPDRKYWNSQQQALRQGLTQATDLSKTMELFLGQHAMVHSAKMAQSALWSFEDQALEGLSGQQMRFLPPNREHSIAWIIWHLTRIEDVTMNLLVAGCPQVLSSEAWLEPLQVAMLDTGNAMNADSVMELSASIDLDALRAYRLSVGRRTREIVKTLQWKQIKQKVDQHRLRQIKVEGAVVEAAGGLLDYWGGLTIAGLLLMPPTRHPFVHWNEALQIKQKIMRNA